MSRRRLLRGAPAVPLLLMALVFLWRLWVALHNPLPLYVDEAYYWTWAQHLDWGYYSKPPVVAWAIAASTALCGDGEACVRAAPLLAYPLTSALVFLVARRLFDTRVAAWAALVFYTLPAVSLSSLIVSTDVFLLLCWALALHAFLRARDTNAWRHWLLLGAALGLGLMSKYTMVIFPLSALLYLLSERPARPLLWSARAWTALALGLALFLPNLWWNWRHGFPTLQHTAQISNLSHAGLYWDELTEFLAGQFLVFGPLAFGVLLYLLTVRAPTLWRERRYWLLACFTVPMLAVISAQALFGRANANWAATAYLAASVLVTAWLLRARHRRLLAALLLVHLALMGTVYHYEALLRLTGIPLTSHNDPFKRLRGWRELNAAVARWRARHPQALLLADRRDILSELAYYQRPARVLSWNPHHALRHHFDLTTDLAPWRGHDFLFVARHAPGPELTARFQRAEPLAVVEIPAWPDRTLRFHLTLLHDFRGYAP